MSQNANFSIKAPKTFFVFSKSALISSFILTALCASVGGYALSPNNAAVHKAKSQEDKAWAVLDKYSEDTFKERNSERAILDQTIRAIATQANLIALREGIQRLKEKESLPAPDALFQRLYVLDYAQGAHDFLNDRSFKVESISYSGNTVVLHMVNVMKGAPISSISYEDVKNGKIYLVGEDAPDKDTARFFTNINDISKIKTAHGKEKIYSISGNDITLYL